MKKKKKKFVKKKKVKKKRKGKVRAMSVLDVVLIFGILLISKLSWNASIHKFEILGVIVHLPFSSSKILPYLSPVITK